MKGGTLSVGLMKEKYHRKLLEKNILFNFVIGPFIAVGSQEWNTLSPSLDRTYNIGKYMFINAIVFIL
jgi:hypothetical protein